MILKGPRRDTDYIYHPQTRDFYLFKMHIEQVLKMTQGLSDSEHGSIVCRIPEFESWHHMVP